MKITYMVTPINKYTFTSKAIKRWVESHCHNKLTLNLFAGKTRLSFCKEVRNDVNITIDADYHFDALDFIEQWKGDAFEMVILDPPFSHRKSMQFYQGHRVSKFRQIKDSILKILRDDGEVITFGYQSVSMSKIRGFEQKEILLMNHGGCVNDTIAVLEQRTSIIDQEDIGDDKIISVSSVVLTEHPDSLLNI